MKEMYLLFIYTSSIFLSFFLSLEMTMDVKMGSKPEKLYIFYESLKRYEELRESDYENHMGFISILMKHYYSKYTYLLYVDSTYLSMIERLETVIKPIIYSRDLSRDLSRDCYIRSFLKVEKGIKKVLEYYLKTLCLYLSKTRLPCVLNREIAGYLFGNISETVFVLPPKELLRIKRSHRVNYKNLKTSKKTSVK